MIEISNVLATSREMRPVFGAWPVVRVWGYIVRGWAAAVLLSILALTFWLAGADVALWIEACLVALVLGLSVLGAIANRQVERVTRATPLGGEAGRWVLDDAGVRIASAFGEQGLDWRAIVRVVEEKDRFIFAVTPARNHILPLRCLRPDQLDALRTLIAEVGASGRLGRGVD